MKRYMVFAVMVAFGLAVSLNVHAEEKVFRHEFKVTPGQGSLVYEGIADDVEIRSHDKNEILFTFKKTLSDDVNEDFAAWFREIKPEVKQDGDTVTIKIRYPKRKKKNFGSSWMKAELKTTMVLPHACNVHLKVIDGDVSVEGVKGELGFNLVDGDLTMTRCSGSYDLHTVDGDTTITEGSGALMSRTVDGDLEATGAFDQVFVKSTDGDAVIRISGVDAMADDWTLGGVDGDFTLVISEKMAFRLEAGTMDGDVEVDGVSGMTVLKKKRNRLIAERGNATHTIHFSTVDGDLTVKQQ